MSRQRRFCACDVTVDLGLKSVRAEVFRERAGGSMVEASHMEADRSVGRKAAEPLLTSRQVYQRSGKVDVCDHLATAGAAVTLAEFCSTVRTRSASDAASGQSSFVQPFRQYGRVDAKTRGEAAVVRASKSEVSRCHCPESLQVSNIQSLQPAYQPTIKHPLPDRPERPLHGLGSISN